MLLKIMTSGMRGNNSHCICNQETKVKVGPQILLYIYYETLTYRELVPTFQVHSPTLINLEIFSEWIQRCSR